MPCYLFLYFLVNYYFRSSHQRYAIKKGVAKNYAISTGKTLSWIESLFNKVAGLQECNFITFKNTYFEE